MLNKHKLFLLCAKWIPVVTAIGILVTNTIAYYGCNDIVVDIFNFNIGTSVAGVILMYVCSDALIQSDIRRVAEHADFNLFRRTCRMITGELVLPNTPTVTGYPSYNPCRVDNSTSTPAA